MGSAEAEVSPSTTDLVLECAYFQPTRVRRTRRALELASESSYRFERGIDMLGMPDALRRAVELIVAVAGGELREPPLDLWPEPQHEKTIFVRPERVAHLLGMPVDPAEIERRLSAVGFFLAPKDGRLAVQVPGWRPDVTREADLRRRLLPGLVRRVEHNWANHNRDIRLFEVGTVFRRGSGSPVEEWTSVAAVLTGARRPPHWSEGAKLPDMDIWDLKRHFEL